MAEWFTEAFRSHYLSIYAHRDEVEARATVDLLQRTLQLPEGSRVLDIPCGAGRHAREFAARGYRAAAMDLSHDMLAAAVKAIISKGPQVCYARSDMRAIPCQDDSFDLVTNLFSSFGYMRTDEENLGVLHELHRVCARQKWVVLDLFNEQRVRERLNPESVRKASNGWVIHEHRSIESYPPRVVKDILVQLPDGQQKHYCESVRLYKLEELKSAFDEVGLELEHTFGDYHGRPYCGASPRVILIGRKR